MKQEFIEESLSWGDMKRITVNAVFKSDSDDEVYYVNIEYYGKPTLSFEFKDYGEAMNYAEKLAIAAYENFGF